MTELEKKIIFHIESMRDGCSREVLYNYISSEKVNQVLDDFIEKGYLMETDSLILINYDKIKINTWIDAIIKD